MNSDIISKCYSKFELRERKGQGNQMYTYVSNKDIIHRMNTIFAGNWSSEVLHTETIDSQVVVRVRVCITDPESGKVYHHEGFGSNQIARYTGGQNEGKIIDIGNAYKGALSKGIVNACRMWGVGLFKEEGVDFDEDDTDVAVPAFTSAAPTAHVAPASPRQAVPLNQPVSVPVVAVSAIPSKPVLPSAADLPSRPELPVRPEAVNKPAPVQQPVAPVADAPTTDLPFSATQPQVNKINDVQKVAISGILTLRKMTYDQLATEAFDDAGAPGYQYPPVENLTYDEAVIVIKYGNNKFRKH